MMEWEECLKLMKILDSYDISYKCGDYYDDEDCISGHWIEIQETFIDSEEI